MCPEMHDTINLNLAPCAEAGSVENRRASGDKYVILKRTAYETGVRADQTVVANDQSIASCSAQDRSVHNDCSLSDAYSATFGNYDGIEADRAAVLNLNVTHDCRIRRDANVFTDRRG